MGKSKSRPQPEVESVQPSVASASPPVEVRPPGAAEAPAKRTSGAKIALLIWGIPLALLALVLLRRALS